MTTTSVSGLKAKSVMVGLVLGAVAMMGGAAFLLNTPRADACYASSYPVTSCSGCYLNGGGHGKEECDFRSGGHGSYAYCIAAGEDCYSD
jgi:hypothetical protein